jgi:tetratricopeptide (TPR) repeat protein
MLTFAILLSTLCGLLSAVAVIALTVSFTKSQRERHPFLRRLPRWRLWLFIAAIFFAAASYSANAWKDILLARPATAISQQGSGEFLRNSTLSGFQKEIQDTAKERAAEATEFYSAGYRDFFAGRAIDAVENFQKSLAALPTMAAYLNLGLSLLSMGQFQLAEEAFKSGMAISVSRDDEELREAFLADLGILMLVQRRFQESENFLTLALEIGKRANNNAKIACTLFNLGELYKAQGKLHEAEHSYQSALAYHPKANQPALHATTVTRLGDVYGDQKKFDEALKTYRVALKMHESVNNTFGEASTLSGIATVFAFQNKNDDALTWFQRALEKGKNSGDLRFLATTMGQIGVLLASSGRYAEAIEMFKNAVDLDETNKNLLQKALALKFMGQAYRARKHARGGEFHEKGA